MRKPLVLLACLWSCTDAPDFSPQTTCAPIVGAWQRQYEGGGFVGATLEPGGTVAVLQHPDEGPARIVRLDAQGRQVALVDLPTDATGVVGLHALPNGGWLAWDLAVRRLDTTGTPRWSFGAGLAGQYFPSVATAPDGTVLVLGHGVGAGLRWVRLDAGDGHVLQAVDWPEVESSEAIVGLADGAVCATGMAQSADWPQRYIARLACWTADGTQRAVSALGRASNGGVHAGLLAWPDHTLRAVVRACDSGSCAQQVLHVDLPSLATSAVVDIDSSGTCCGTMSGYSLDEVAMVTPDPRGGMVDVHVEDRWQRWNDVERLRTTWQRRAADGHLLGEVVLADFYARDDGVIAMRGGQYVDVSALLRMADGGWWAVGSAWQDDMPSQGWILRLPPSACAEVAK